MRVSPSSRHGRARRSRIGHRLGWEAEPPLLRRSSAAAVVNTSSVVAHVGVRNRALYAASKGAVSALTLATAADHLADGPRVNAVTPGTADTPWVARLLGAAADPDREAAALRAR